MGQIKPWTSHIPNKKDSDVIYSIENRSDQEPIYMIFKTDHPSLKTPEDDNQKQGNNKQS